MFVILSYPFYKNQICNLWSIIIFCYNEVKTIRQVIGETENVLNTISENGNEIIIVDDGSFDGSTEIIKELEYANPIIKAVYHQRNKGIAQH